MSRSRLDAGTARRSCLAAAAACAAALVLAGCVQVNVKRATPPLPDRLAGSRWLLEDLAGRGVLDRAQATLEFPAAGRIAGNGSCNRFTGAATIDGDRLKVDTVAATRMACPPALMEQEDRYLAALGAAERIELEGPWLLVHVRGLGAPLKFTRRK